MGEKVGGVWLIVVVVILAGLLIFLMSQFFKEGIGVLGIPLEEQLNELRLWLESNGVIGGGEDPPVVE